MLIISGLTVASDNTINDYKFFCFNGHVEFMKVDFDRNTSHRANYYDRNFHLLEFGEEECPPDITKTIDKPTCFEKMIVLAEKIARNVRFLRVDFYESMVKFSSVKRRSIQSQLSVGLPFNQPIMKSVNY